MGRRSIRPGEVHEVSPSEFLVASSCKGRGSSRVVEVLKQCSVGRENEDRICIDRGL